MYCVRIFHFFLLVTVVNFPLEVKGLCVFVVGCLDPWMTVSKLHNTTSVTCYTEYTTLFDASHKFTEWACVY